MNFYAVICEPLVPKRSCTRVVFGIAYIDERFSELYLFFAVIFISGCKFYLRPPPLFLIWHECKGEIVHNYVLCFGVVCREVRQTPPVNVRSV